MRGLPTPTAWLLVRPVTLRAARGCHSVPSSYRTWLLKDLSDHPPNMAAGDPGQLNAGATPARSQPASGQRPPPCPGHRALSPGPCALSPGPCALLGPLGAREVALCGFHAAPGLNRISSRTPVPTNTGREARRLAAGRRRPSRCEERRARQHRGAHRGALRTARSAAQGRRGRTGTTGPSRPPAGWPWPGSAPGPTPRARPLAAARARRFLRPDPAQDPARVPRSCPPRPRCQPPPAPPLTSAALRTRAGWRTVSRRRGARGRGGPGTDAPRRETRPPPAAQRRSAAPSRSDPAGHRERRLRGTDSAWNPRGRLPGPQPSDCPASRLGKLRPQPPATGTAPSLGARVTSSGPGL